MIDNEGQEYQAYMHEYQAYMPNAMVRVFQYTVLLIVAFFYNYIVTINACLI